MLGPRYTPILTGIPNDIERIPLEEGLARVYHQHTLIVGTFYVQKSLKHDPANGGRVVSTKDGRLQPLSVDLEGYYVKPVKSDTRRMKLSRVEQLSCLPETLQKDNSVCCVHMHTIDARAHRPTTNEIPFCAGQKLACSMRAWSA